MIPAEQQTYAKQRVIEMIQREDVEIVALEDLFKECVPEGGFRANTPTGVRMIYLLDRKVQADANAKV